MNLGAADEVEIDEISRIIESDPAMTARVLGLCRRADRGLGDRITSVKRAVVMLGLDAVRAAVLCVTVYGLMKDPPGERARPGDSGDSSTACAVGFFDRHGFWKYSIAVACAAELLAGSVRSFAVRPDEAFVAGLLHALGKPVLELVLPRAYGRVVALAEKQCSDIAAVERSVIGLDHHTAGKRIAEHWKLPSPIRDVMWLHGQPYRSLPETTNRPLIALITLARAVCRELHLGWSGDFGPSQDTARLCSGMGIPPLNAESLMEPLHAAVADRLNILGLESTTPPTLMLESFAAANKALAKLNHVLESRARNSAANSRVLEAVSAFNASIAADSSLTACLAAVARSASSVLGDGVFAFLHQANTGAPCRVYAFESAFASGDDPEPPRTSVATPPTASAPFSISSLHSNSGIGRGASAIPGWLLDSIGSGLNVKSARVLPLGTQSQAEIVLIHDRDGDARGLSAAALRPLVSCWSAAVAAASRQDEASRLSERLAEVNRSLIDTQARLTETESLARLGEVTAGAAHEMNNPLTIINGHAQLLLQRAKDAKDRAGATAIVKAGETLSDLISSLHIIASPPEPRFESAELAWAVREAAQLAKERVGPPGRVDFQLSDSPHSVRIDLRLFTQVLSELIANGVEADREGMVTITSDIDPFDDRLLIRVSDTGPGLTPKARAHAFDPFFSERAAGRGRGLGLTRARRLAEAFGGSIALNNNPDRGATATLMLTEWRNEVRAREAA